jgi:hypothetical protein
MRPLDDIIKAITETDEKTSAILRKCLVLSYILKNNTLKSWALKELNGYSNDDPELPDYRKITAPAYGLFVGGAGRSIDDQPLPPAILKKEHRHFAERAALTQPIVAYETVKADEGRIIPWPANLTVLYQSKFFSNDLTLNRAWQDISGSALAGVADTVRTRLLTFVLELNEQQGEGHEVKIEDISSATVQTLVQMTVIGGNNVFGNVEQFAAQTVQTGDLKSLRGTLAALGVDHKELEALQLDMAADQQNDPHKNGHGKRTSEWIGRNAKAAGKGALKIGTDVATAVISEAIKRFMGM